MTYLGGLGDPLIVFWCRHEDLYQLGLYLHNTNDVQIIIYDVSALNSLRFGTTVSYQSALRYYNQLFMMC